MTHKPLASAELEKFKARMLSMYSAHTCMQTIDLVASVQSHDCLILLLFHFGKKQRMNSICINNINILPLGSHVYSLCRTNIRRLKGRETQRAESPFSTKAKSLKMQKIHVRCHCCSYIPIMENHRSLACLSDRREQSSRE